MLRHYSSFISINMIPIMSGHDHNFQLASDSSSIFILCLISLLLRCDVTKKSVTKYTPETQCTKIPVEICGPASCALVPGPQECFEKKVTIAGEKPEELCNLEPQRTCKHVTKLVPQLKPHESCTDVPKEVCTRSQTNPRKVKKPVVKKWCYTPTEESGLTDSSSLAEPAEQCPAKCARAVASGQCDPSCDQFEYLCGPCVPTCPDKCARAVASGRYKRDFDI